MFCSVVIPTIGRSTLARAVLSALEQEFTPNNWEIIVVNDSGKALSPEIWQDSPQVRIIQTNMRERCFARNAGAAVALGNYLWFLDDDDRILPGALQRLWALTQQQPNALWLYGGLNVVDEKGNLFGRSNSALSGNCAAQVIGGAWVPIQSSIIQAAAFFQVGGYDPLMITTQDQDLCRRISLQGEIANLEEPVACLLRGDYWQTSTDYSRAPKDTRASRNKILAQPGTFKRLLASARDPYWYGRLVRVYLSTVAPNLRRRNLFIALSRLLHAAAMALLAGPRLLAPNFWRGMRADHVPGSLHFIMKEAEAAAQLRSLPGFTRPL